MGDPAGIIANMIRQNEMVSDFHYSNMMETFTLRNEWGYDDNAYNLFKNLNYNSKEHNGKYRSSLTQEQLIILRKDRRIKNTKKKISKRGNRKK